MGTTNQKQDLTIDDIWPSETVPSGEPLDAEPVDESKRVLIAATHTNQVLPPVAFVLGVLVIMCLVLAAIVWWRLLT